MDLHFVRVDLGRRPNEHPNYWNNRAGRSVMELNVDLSKPFRHPQEDGTMEEPQPSRSCLNLGGEWVLIRLNSYL